MVRRVDPWTLWRGSHDTRPRSWWPFALASALLHFPLTPLAALLGLVGLLLPHFAEDDSPPVVMTEIPIEMFEADPLAGVPAPAAAEPPTAAPAEADEVAAAPSKPQKAKKPDSERSQLDAGVADAGTDAGASDAGVADAGLTDAGLPDAGRPLATNDAGPPDAGVSPPATLRDAGSPGVLAARDAGASMADPVALAGAARRIVDSNSNVKLTIDTAKLRSHPLGRDIGALLAAVPQWRDFFGPTGIDVVRDTDQIMITGPQLRRSGDVVAVIRHRVSKERMHEALDRLVRREQAPGEWLDASVPIAKATADRAPRLFALASPRVVIVAPVHLLASVEKSAKSIGRAPPRPLAGRVVVSARVKAPSRAFRGVVPVPESILWVSISAEPREDGGVIINIEAEDADAETAAHDARMLERTITQMTQIDLGFVGRVLGQAPHRFVESVEFQGQGNIIRGSVSASAAQIASALELAGGYIGVPARPSAGRPRSAPASSR